MYSPFGRLTILLSMGAALLCAHGGGLDAQGGHHDRKNGGYHYHRAPTTKTKTTKKAEAAGQSKKPRAHLTKSKTSGTKPSEFRCGSKRYCREMTSCAEARHYLDQCGLSRLDGDNDGVPCESICE